jgi:sarcosine oxidase
MPETRHCIVVGAGLLGLCCARELARRGWDVVVLEAGATPGHERSGSKGDARIFRLGYPEPHYVDMAVLARARWHDLEAAIGHELLTVTGQVTSGDESMVHAIAGALGAAGAPVEQISANEAERRFPGVAVSGTVLFESESGVLAADACLRALRAAGEFELRTGDPVTALRPGPDAVIAETAGGASHRADVLVVCAGAASLRLLDLTTAAAAAPSLPQVAYFPLRHAQRMPPIFIEWGDAMLYGLPVPGSGPHAGSYKVSHHTPGPALDVFDPSDPAPLGRDDPALLAQLTNAVARLLPSLHPVPEATERCVYDNSADTDFIMDRVGRIVVGCGTSGHAFKFGPLLGELLADLAEDKRPAVDLERFSLRRHPTSPDRAAPPSR